MIDHVPFKYLALFSRRHCIYITSWAMPHEKNTCDPETQNVYMLFYLFCSQPHFLHFFTPPPEQHGYSVWKDSRTGILFLKVVPHIVQGNLPVYVGDMTFSSSCLTCALTYLGRIPTPAELECDKMLQLIDGNSICRNTCRNISQLKLKRQHMCQ